VGGRRPRLPLWVDNRWNAADREVCRPQYKPFVIAVKTAIQSSFCNPLDANNMIDYIRSAQASLN
jgi:hypothetical protein